MSTTQTKTHTHTNTRSKAGWHSSLPVSRLSLHQHNTVTFWRVTWTRRQTRLHYQQLAGDVCARVCVYQSSSVCVRVRKSVRVQVKAEPSAADKPHQVSLLCLTRTQPLASGGEKPLIGKGRNTHTDTHTHLL